MKGFKYGKTHRKGVKMRKKNQKIWDTVFKILGYIGVVAGVAGIILGILKILGVF